MNSDQERELFEAHGWQYDTVQRRWTAPDGHTVNLEDLIVARNVMRPASLDAHLRDIAIEHGRRPAP